MTRVHDRGGGALPVDRFNSYPLTIETRHAFHPVRARTARIQLAEDSGSAGHELARMKVEQHGWLHEVLFPSTGLAAYAVL